jgi:hypothetical protein
MNLWRLTRGLLALYALVWALRAAPWLMRVGAVTLQSVRERSAGPLLEVLRGSPQSVGGVGVVLAIVLLSGRLAALLVRALPDRTSLDGTPLLRTAQVLVGAVLVLSAVPAAAQSLLAGIRPLPYRFQLHPDATTELATAALWLTAGLVLVVGLRTLARFVGRLGAQRPER